MKLLDVYNGIVWTESALDFLKQSPAFDETVYKLHSCSKVQIVLSPGARAAQEVRDSFERRSLPAVVLAFDTQPAKRGAEGFPRCCAQTFRAGIRQINAFAKSKSSKALRGPLGALVPKIDLSIEEALESRPKEEARVLWQAVEAGEFIFLGPDLPNLAELVLVHYGLDPERTLWVCRLRRETAQNSVDLGVALRSNKPNKIRPVLVGDSSLEELIQGFHIAYPKVELGGMDVGKQLGVLSSAVVTPPVRLHHDCDLLRSKRIFRDLSGFRNLANDNRRRAVLIIRGWHETRLEKPEKKWFPQSSDRLTKDGFVFDNKSGAIGFDAYEWENKIKSINEQPWKKVVAYFEETLGGLWLKDRPNLARRLETPTKTILRGEEYYLNMANLPPVERISQIARHFASLFTICDLRMLFEGWDTLWKWKLALATCDQLRNCILQINWFAYQMGRNQLTKFAITTKELAAVIPDLTDAAVGLYYSALLFERGRALNHLGTLSANHTILAKSVEDSVKTLWEIGKKTNDMTFTHKFVRRWREADHPGENLLTAALAIDFSTRTGPKDLLALGISWGGIELPLVFKHAWLITQGDLPCPLVLVADYSHYRQDEPSRELPYIALVPSSPVEPIPGSRVIVFDDNVLTGLTIEHIQDDLLKRGCKVLAVFVTRISGGRRYGQMRMPDHGVLNPEIVGKLVVGFLGETPFALTWSREKYVNPIGIFSLARRRILELLHANSSVERYDREGF